MRDEQAVRAPKRKESIIPEAYESPGATTGSMVQAKPTLGTYLGIFLVAASVLLFQLALTRIFAVVLWAHLAFMVISTALFGFGLSGVFLALRPRPVLAKPRFAQLCLLACISMIGVYLVITNVPFRMWAFAEDPMNFVYLGLWYLSLVVPFFFAGLLVAELLTTYSAQASRLYGVDLIGAAFGSFMLIPLITGFGGEGVAMWGALLMALAGVCLCVKGQTVIRGILVASILGFAYLIPNAAEVLPLKYHQNKRRYNEAITNDKVLATRWSPLSKVDIATHRGGIYDIWIDGGTNESAIFAWNGDAENLEPLKWSSIGASYWMKQGELDNVMVIGPSGGKEVLFALSYGAKHVDAVELDPSIVALVNQSPFKEFMGGLYQHEKVTLHNDEGRAFLRRQPSNSYDVIQFVNNYTPVAIAAGALNLSETFLITKEAFIDFYDRLKPGGVLALHRGASVRVALTAIEALREIGVEDPASQLFITAGEVPFFEGFFLKKGKWAPEDEKKLHEYMKVRRRVGGKTFLWTPFHPERDNFYAKILSSTAEEQRAQYTSHGINLYPATDNQPFMEHFLQFGKRDLSMELPREFRHRNSQKWRGIIPRGDFPYVAILAESAVLALLFVALPLILRARGAVSTPGFGGFLTYFSALGFGFIAVEICLMKRYVLFLGNPVYSITTTLVALLLGAGLGSMVSERFGKRNPRTTATWILLAVAGAILLETWISPIVFAWGLQFSFATRIAIATMLLVPLGFVMGMPFPFGLHLISLLNPDPADRTRVTAWAWGMNGYTTVIGSALSVFIALFLGFKAVLLTGVAVYLCGLIAIRSATKSLPR